jgi:methylated-DNA-[protein]-cysteine S-methyltransferase
MNISVGGPVPHYDWLPSPIGELLLISDGEHLTGLYTRVSPALRKSTDKWTRDEPALRETRAQLNAYFAGELKEFDLPMVLEGTEFQRKVWELLCEIPYGVTTSYGELARRLGTPSASRAVGLANGSNPISIIVPCHRVIGADGSLTGYGGGLERKEWLLKHEGALLL